jgi:tRNA(adenine34) deaminase
VRLGDATIFSTLEPCAMCVGALLESDVEALVYAVPNRDDGAAGTVIQLAQHPDLPRRIRVVSGIRRDEAEELFAAAPATGRQ